MECRSVEPTETTGIIPRPFFPKLSPISCRYHFPMDSSSGWKKKLLLIILPVHQFSYNTAAEISGVSRSARLAFAPSIRADMSTPQAHRGNSPTADKIEKRPPTSFGIGRTGKLLSRAERKSLESESVITATLEAKSGEKTVSKSARVSVVTPDLLITQSSTSSGTKFSDF